MQTGADDGASLEWLPPDKPRAETAKCYEGGDVGDAVDEVGYAHARKGYT